MRALSTYSHVDETETEYVLHNLEKQFRLVGADLQTDWDSRSKFDMVLTQLDRQSSPGWPLMREASTIDKWLFLGNPFPDPNRANALWSMVQDVFEGRYNHLYKVFIKAEPHPKAKADENRWRLIMMSSLPVQVAWHMTVGHLEDKFLQVYYSPLMHGLVYFGGGWSRFRDYYRNKSLDWCADKSGWDWNSPGWVYHVCRELRKRLTRGATQRWERVLDLLYVDAYVNSRVILPDGTILEQMQPGLMKSGLVVTITDNGISQVGLHVLAEKKLGARRTMLVATGDDTFQQAPLDSGEYVRALQSVGCVVKEYGPGTDFMGFEISADGFRPKYIAKHLETLKLQKDEFLAETLEGYLRIYVHDEEKFSFYKYVASKLGYSMPSRAYFLYFANNPDALEIYSGLARPSFGDRDVGGGVCC